MMRHEAAEDVLRENSSMYEELLSNIPSWVYRLRIQAYGALISSVAAFVSYLTLFGEFVEVGVMIKKLCVVNRLATSMPTSATARRFSLCLVFMVMPALCAPDRFVHFTFSMIGGCQVPLKIVLSGHYYARM
jgi:hypothetical protein